MKKSKTTIIFLTSILLAMFSISIFVFFIKVIQNKDKHIQAVTQTLEEKMAEKNQIDVFRSNNSFLKNSQETINSYFVNSEDISTFIDYLEKVGSQGGAKLTVKNVETPKTKDKYVSVNFIIEGTFLDVMKSIQAVENIHYKIQLRSVSLNKNTDIEKGSSWEAQVSFDVLVS